MTTYTSKNLDVLAIAGS